MVDQFSKGVHKADGGTAVIRKLPVGRRHLLEAPGRRDLDFNLGTALWASLLLGYFFELRANNWAALDAKAYDPARIITRQDVTFFAGFTRVSLTTTTAVSITSVRLPIKSTKTDQLGKGFERDMYKNSDPALCVVKALVRHLLLTSDLPGEWPVAAYDPDRGGSTNHHHQAAPTTTTSKRHHQSAPTITTNQHQPPPRSTKQHQPPPSSSSTKPTTKPTTKHHQAAAPPSTTTKHHHQAAAPPSTTTKQQHHSAMRESGTGIVMVVSK